MVRVKICGITNVNDALAAVDAGADLLGFIFYPPSPRYVEAAAVREIIEETRRRGIPESIRQNPSHNGGASLPKMVGVFVDEPADQVAHILNVTGLDYAQLHGDEPPATLKSLAPIAFKALRPASAEEAQVAAESYAKLSPPYGPQMLVDAYDPDEYGGTGKKADWNAAAGLARLYPRLVLAGGLKPENVAQAIRIVKPWGIDVSSGVEDEPGRKNHAAIRHFIQSARAAAM